MRACKKEYKKTHKAGYWPYLALRAYNTNDGSKLPTEGEAMSLIAERKKGWANECHHLIEMFVNACVLNVSKHKTNDRDAKKEALNSRKLETNREKYEGIEKKNEAINQGTRNTTTRTCNGLER